MHSLLHPADRLERLKRRTDALAAWRIRTQLPLLNWTFDDAPIAVGAPWPDREGRHEFRCERFEVPAAWDLADVRLELDVGGESLLHIIYDQAPSDCAGLDPWHQSFPLAGRNGALKTESVARGLLAQPSPDPRLRFARLVCLHREVDEFVRTLNLVIAAAEALGEHEVTPALVSVGEEAIAAVRTPTATAAVLSRAPDMAFLYNGRPRPAGLPPQPLGDDGLASVRAAFVALTNNLRGLQERYPPQGAIALVGHAHIDTAWLWTLEETRRKVQRSFSTVANLLDAHPEFRFAQSFAEYYQYLESHDPALFSRVCGHVAAGRWEPVGGLWIEPDVVMPTGESLARQTLYGQRYFKRTFVRYHTVGWLPDTFGFSPALPQILRLAGIKTLFTVKMGWSESNRFPHTRFWWQGIDGSEVLVHHFVNRDSGFNGAVEPAKLLRVWRNHTDKHTAHETLYPIGYGDGGGGPTTEMIEAREALRIFPVLPRLRFAGVSEYFADALTQNPARLDRWVGELYLELHRGVLTSQGRMKSLHRRAERDLLAAEALASAAHLLGGPMPRSLQALWRPLMINQFHDILPGSSIADVHEQAQRELAEIIAGAAATTNAAISEIAARVVPKGDTPAVLAINPDLCARPMRLWSPEPLPGGQAVADGWVLCQDETAPPFSASVVIPSRVDDAVMVTTEVLENRFIRVEFSSNGTIARLFDKIAQRDVLSGPGNQLWAYRDQPRFFDAWDLEEDYERVGEQAFAAEPITVLESGPERAALEIRRRIANSTIVQSVRLWRNSPRLDFETQIDCRDRQLLLKAVFPLAVRSDHATFECAFGVLRRPTHRNTSWDAARFEVAGHRFADLSETGYGVALINNGRYGYHAKASELGLSLLRSPIAPDATADEGLQTLGYALLPHRGDWASAGVLAEAEDFNRPLLVRAVHARASYVHCFLEARGLPMALGCLKPAEVGPGLVLRVYEPAGARGQVSVVPPPGWHTTAALDLLEEELGPVDDSVRPFEIKTWRLTSSDH